MEVWELTAEEGVELMEVEQHPLIQEIIKTQQGLIARLNAEQQGLDLDILRVKHEIEGLKIMRGGTN
jgi:hypothetical protein